MECGDDDLNDIEELEMIGGKDFGKNEDKFNQVLSTSKENGGLLASIGLKKGDNDESIGEDSQEEDPHKKSDLFDTSKDRIKGGANKADKNHSGDEDFNLGFDSSKKAGGKKKEDAKDDADGLEDSNVIEMSPEGIKAIEENFMKYYENDPELRAILHKIDPSTLSFEEKYNIMKVYEERGPSALQIDVQDDDDIDESQMSDRDIAEINENFDQLYAVNPWIKEELGPLSNITFK